MDRFVEWDRHLDIPRSPVLTEDDFVHWFVNERPTHLMRSDDIRRSEAQRRVGVALADRSIPCGEEGSFRHQLKSFAWSNTALAQVHDELHFRGRGISLEDFWSIYVERDFTDFDDIEPDELDKAFDGEPRRIRHLTVIQGEGMNPTPPEDRGFLWADGSTAEDFSDEDVEDEDDDEYEGEEDDLEVDLIELGSAQGKEVNENVIAHLQMLLGLAARGEIQKLATISMGDEPYIFLPHFSGHWPSLLGATVLEQTAFNIRANVRDTGKNT
jgi:hypothetical protein